jgi:lipopolysaccharide transport system permease protein
MYHSNTEVIRPKRSLFELNLKEVWNYRDLLMMFVRRDFVAGYKQTILGPLWFFIQPIFTTIMFTFVFGNIANISTDGQPKILFYLSGLTIWNYFAECFTKTSNIFIANAGIFGKVYFPRLISPLSIVVSGLMRFGVQMVLFLGFLFYFNLSGSETVKPNLSILLFPVLVFLMAGFALGFGMIISSLTTKYRDLTMLISFGVTLLMYATPIIYPINSIPEKYKTYVLANPLAPVVETFRYAFLGSGNLNWIALGYSTAWVVILLSFGVIIFNRVQQTFMDTV